MKWLLSLVCCVHLGAAELAQVHSVYLLPLRYGLDQFVANSLTRTHLFQVVTDPAKADAVLTDQVGEPLETRLKDLYPPPAHPHPEGKDASAKDASAKDASAKDASAKDASAKDAPKEHLAVGESETDEAAVEEYRAQHGIGSMLNDPVNKVEKTGATASLGRGRGTIFLVDVKSRQVLWSAFERPKNSTPGELDRTAQRIVKRLKVDLTPKESN